MLLRITMKTGELIEVEEPTEVFVGGIKVHAWTTKADTPKTMPEHPDGIRFAKPIVVGGIKVYPWNTKKPSKQTWKE